MCFRITGKSYRWLLAVIILWLSVTGSVRAELAVIGGLTREYTITAGGQYFGQIFLENKSQQPLTVKIYQKDYFFQAGGRVIYADPGTVPRSNAAWFSFSEEQLTIPPGERLPAAYTITVPLKANNLLNWPDFFAERPDLLKYGGKEEFADQKPDFELRGTYWSLLMVEPIDSGLNTEYQKEEVTVNIKQTVRRGIQLVTQIGDTGQRELKIVDRKLSKIAVGHYLFQLDIENSGESWLRPDIWAEIYDRQEGNLVARIDCGYWRLFPRTSRRLDLKLKDYPPGTFKIIVIIDNGDEHLWGAGYSLELK